MPWPRSNTQAIIYVVDSCDVDRLPTSREEFAAILEEEELRDAAILVYANKQVGRRGRGRGDSWVGGRTAGTCAEQTCGRGRGSQFGAAASRKGAKHPSTGGWRVNVCCPRS
jgi:hypothetical protein